MSTEMYERAYWDTQKVLDEALGTREEDGSGGGLAAEVHLLAQQRDEARAEVERTRAELGRLHYETGPYCGGCEREGKHTYPLGNGDSPQRHCEHVGLYTFSRRNWCYGCKTDWPCPTSIAAGLAAASTAGAPMEEK